MSRSASNGERVAAVPIAPGIFVLRYFASRAATPPRLFAQASPASENPVTLIFPPGSETGVLSRPGAYAVIVAERGGRVHVTLLGAPGEDDGVEVKIEPISGLLAVATASAAAESVDESVPEMRAKSAPMRRTRPPATSGGAQLAGASKSFIGNSEAVVLRRPSTPPAPTVSIKEQSAPARCVEGTAAGSPDLGPERELRPELNDSGFGFVCHVARKGDLGSAGGGWIGGPAAPAVIEGVALHWNAPTALDLEYQVLAPGAQNRWSAWVKTGAYAGTRGRGLPIVGLRVRIAGRSAKRFRLHGEAIFLGLPAVADAGESLEFSSYAGVDPMVGLRLDLLPNNEAEAERHDRTKTSPPQEDTKPGIRRLQVFRSMRAEERAV